MWQSIIELISKFLGSITSVSNTTKEFIPIIEKRQEIRTPVQEAEAENDVIDKKLKQDDKLQREIRKDLKHGFEPNEIVAHYKQSLGIDVSILVDNEFDNLKNNKKRLHKLKNK